MLKLDKAESTLFGRILEIFRNIAILNSSELGEILVKFCINQIVGQSSDKNFSV
jgi:hypothetical protein